MTGINILQILQMQNMGITTSLDLAGPHIPGSQFSHGISLFHLHGDYAGHLYKSHHVSKDVPFDLLLFFSSPLGCPCLK